MTGISGVPSAGEEFIVVADEKEARSIAEARQGETRQKQLQARSAVSLDNLLQAASDSEKKMLNIILRADVQGSLEALKVGLLKIESEKVQLNIVLAGVGEISESDVQLAASSKAVILGFHTGIESHAEPLIRQHAIQVNTHDIIYHAIDQVRDMMTGLLDKIGEEEERGQAKVLATFKSSAIGTIAGCIVTDGVIHRNHRIRIMRDGEKVWNGSINSIKRVQDDVREVKAGVECGIVLGSGHNVQVDDILEAYEIVYKSQDL
jgi:translation initiation factor IF-2